MESNSISQKKGSSPDNEDYNKENSNRNEYDNDLDRYLDFKTPEKGIGIFTGAENGRNYSYNL